MSECCCPECGHVHTVTEGDPCDICEVYEAEFDGKCKWCMHAVDRARVETEYPELEALP